MKLEKQKKTKIEQTIEVEPITALESVELEEFSFTPLKDDKKEHEDTAKTGFFYPDQPSDSKTTKWAKIVTSSLAFLFAVAGITISLLVWFLPLAIQNNLTAILIIIAVLVSAIATFGASIAGFVLGALRFRKVVGILAMLGSIAGIVSVILAMIQFWNLLLTFQF